MVPQTSSTIVHHRSAASEYPLFVKERQKAVDVLATNLRALMDAHDIKKPELHKRSGVSQRMIAYILSKQRTATVETVEDLARVFGLAAWELLMPDLQPTKIDKVEGLVRNYLQASDSGREYLDRVAEHEAKYRNAAKKGGGDD